MTVATTGRYVTTLVDESIKYLQDAVNKFEVLEQLEVKAAECSTELDFFFYWTDKYTLVQTNVKNKKTEIEIIQLQTKNKISLPYYVYVMRDKMQKRKA